MPISGYKANERPRQFTLDEETYEIAAVLDHWYEPTATYFKVQSVEGKTYLLRYDEEPDEWTLQSGFDGDALLAKPSLELLTVDSAMALTVPPRSTRQNRRAEAIGSYGKESNYLK